MFSPDHITRIKFIFIFTWFIWLISLSLIIIIMEVSILVIFLQSVFFNIHEIKIYFRLNQYSFFPGVMTFDLSICFNLLQSSQKSSIGRFEQVRSLKTVLWPSNLGECKAMMPSILQYYLEFANLFWNHPNFFTMKKSNFVVDCFDSFWMTASVYQYYKLLVVTSAYL